MTIDRGPQGPRERIDEMTDQNYIKIKIIRCDLCEDEIHSDEPTVDMRNLRDEKRWDKRIPAHDLCWAETIIDIDQTLEMSEENARPDPDRKLSFTERIEKAWQLITN